jgi:ADP-L-glycero-D-manno-heptose 6-epimerase
MILVTGGAGFIGSALVWELNRAGIDNILIVDNLGTGEKWKNLTGLKFRDYMQKDKLSAYLENNGLSFRTVFHLGACSSTTETDCNYLIENNYEYSKQLALFCIKNRTPFLYASSAATYGDGAQGFSDTSELHQLKPLNMYGYSKHMFDLWLMRNNLLNSVVGLKFFNVWGPNESHKGSMRSMVMKAWEQIKTDGKVQLFQSHHPDYQDGCQMRDFIYVKDVTRMMLEFFRRPDIRGIFNIGRGKAITWIDLIEPIFHSLKLKPEIEFVPMPQQLREKYQYFTQADMSKYKESGLTHHETPLQDAVSDYVLNYLETGNSLSF